MTKVVFFGSNSYSVVILSSLLSCPEFQVIAIVTKPDAPTGRDQKITPNPVSEFSQNNKLNLLQPNDFDQNFIKKFKELKPDLGLCVAYGPPFFTTEMIAIPQYKIVNLHPSPLPKYRGAAPAPWQIINHETQSALTFFVIDEKPDHGPIITKLSFPIFKKDTSATFYDRAFSLGATNLNTVLTSYVQNPKHVTPQDHLQKSYFPKLTKDSGKIDWTKSPEFIEAFIRGMQPWPGAWTEVVDKSGNKKRTQILSSHLESGKIVLDLVRIEGKTQAQWEDLRQHYQFT